MSKKALINASNLRAGGGVQVATSFIYELLISDSVELDWIDIWVSTLVANSLEEVGIRVVDNPNIRVVDSGGIRAMLSIENRYLEKYDLVFTIFGPNYFLKKDYIDLVGFAQLWILDGSAYKLLPVVERVNKRIKFFLQKLFFKRSDSFVVELEHVRDSLIESGVAKPSSIHVAHNCVSSIYFDRKLWGSLDNRMSSPRFKIGFLGRDYAHKNTDILPDVKRILREEYGVGVDFFVTFDDGEWQAKGKNFRSSIINVGSLSLTQCPTFYESVDAVIFPSVLECFSVTPLEALMMRRPLFASDRRFVRDICGDFAFYFDPHSPNSAAEIIDFYLRNLLATDEARLSLAREHAVGFSNAQSRKNRYIQIIRDELAN